MRSNLSGRRALAVAFAAASTLATSFAAPASAALVHQYTFSGNADDSVGTAHGTLINGATVDATSLITSGAGAGIGLSQASSLPASAVAGVSGDFTVESFFTKTSTGGNFQTGFSFSTGATAADQQNNFLIMSPNRGSATGVIGMAYKQSGLNLGTERVLIAPTPVIGAETYVATTYNSAVGQMTLYTNGALRDGLQANYLVGYNLGAKDQRIGINGNAPFGDPSLSGSTNELRIYNNIESANAIALRFLGGNTANNPVTTNTAVASGDYLTTAFTTAPTAAEDVVIPSGIAATLAGTGNSGLLRIAGGTLDINSGGALSTATNLDLASNGVVNVNTGGVLTIKGVTAGGQAYSASTTGTINLNGGTINTAATPVATQGIAYVAPGVTLNAVTGTTTAIDTINGRITVGAAVTGNGTISQPSQYDLYLQGNLTGFTGTLNIAPVLPAGTGNGGTTIWAPSARNPANANPIPANVVLGNTRAFLVFAGQNDDYITGTIDGGSPGTPGGITGTSIRKTELGTLTLAGNVAVNGEIVANNRSNLAFINNTVTVGSATSNGQIGLLDGGVVGEPRKITLQNATVNSLTTGGRFLFVDTGGDNETRYLELRGNSTLGSGLPLYVKGRSTVPGTLTFTDANRPTSGMVLDNVSGNNTVAGGISIRAIGGQYSIRSQAGTVTIGGNSFNNIANSNRPFELTGAGSGVFTGTLNDGTGTAQQTGLKMVGETTGTSTTGAGSWSLDSLNNNFSGGLTVLNGKFYVNGSMTSTSANATNVVGVYGGTLGGTGSIAQAVTVYAPGTSTGTITFATIGTPGVNGVAAVTGTGGTIAPGTVATPIESLNVGSLVLNGIYAAQLDGAGAGSSDLIAVAGLLNITNGTLNLSQVSPVDDAAYVIASYGSLTGASFASVVGLPAGYSVVLNYNGQNQIAIAVPEPTTLAAIGAVAGLVLRRRRNG